MLCLGLREWDRVRITFGGVEVWVQLLPDRNHVVRRLGFEAPRDVEVVREKVLIQRGNATTGPAGATAGPSQPRGEGS
jgi:hypothetical protein